MNNAQKSLVKLARAIVDLHDSDMLKHAALGETADSARLVPIILDKIATAVDATAVELAFHAGLDGPDFNPSLIESANLSDFAFSCNQAADARDKEHGSFVDFVREHSTLHRQAQGC